MQRRGAIWIVMSATWTSCIELYEAGLLLRAGYRASWFGRLAGFAAVVRVWWHACLVLMDAWFSVFEMFLMLSLILNDMHMLLRCMDSHVGNMDIVHQTQAGLGG